MTVYIEYAFAENTLLDGLLLYLALRCARLRVSGWRLALASAAGGAQSLLFPVFSLPVWLSYLVKFLGGALIAVIGCPSRRLKPHLWVCAAFFLLTFALGGLLFAVSSFFGAELAEGRGVWLERVPPALVLAAAGAFFAAAAALIRHIHRRRAIARGSCACVIEGVRTLRCSGFWDSGNLLSFRGEPVSVLSPVAALALFGGRAVPVGRIVLRSAGGEKTSPVFRAERLTAGGIVREGALFAVGETGIPGHPVLLNTSLWEGEDGHPRRAEKLAAKDTGD